MKRKLTCKNSPVLLAGVFLILAGLLTGCLSSSGSSSSRDRGNDTDSLFPTDSPEDGGANAPDYSPPNPPGQLPGDPVP
jgi:hypothetical protein